MRFFFFGSLLDADVALDAGAALPRYPILVPRAGGRVDGALMRGLSAEDTSRIAWFEEGEYDLAAVSVTLPTGRRLAAHACVTRAHVAQRPGDWTLSRWQREDKPSFMALARLWMSLHGKVSAAEAEAHWDRLKAELAGTAPDVRVRLGS